VSSDSRGPGDGSKPNVTMPAEARRASVRMRAIQGPPSSKPTGTESESYGRIHRIMGWVDANKGAFAVSRLISQLGVNLRAFGADTKDDPRILAKLWPALDVMLSEEEREALLRSLREGG